MEEQLIAIFCEIDDFCKEYEVYITQKLQEDAKMIFPSSRISLSEVMTIAVFFHLSNQKTFKLYYLGYISTYLKKYFPNLVSYNRFVELMKYITVPLTLYTIKYSFGKCSGINFVDSTPIKICDNHRIYQNKVFKDVAKRGKSSMGWFYGFKLHLIINEKGEILSFCLTSGNIDDRNPKVLEHLTKDIFGKLFADRGYLSQKLFENLHSKNIELITKLKKNMQNKLINYADKLILRKRSIIESVNDFLKNICQIEHTRHRSSQNFIANLVAGIVAFSFLPKKPSINFCKNSAIAQ